MQNDVPLDKNPLNLVLVKLEKSEENKKIFGIRTAALIEVRVEEQRRRKQATKCHRCQSFHHTQGASNAVSCTDQRTAVSILQEMRSLRQGQWPDKGEETDPATVNTEGGEAGA